MPAPETDASQDQRLLSDLYNEHRISWEKLLGKFGLPTNIGIVRSMTFGEAKAYAAAKAKKNSDSPNTSEKEVVSTNVQSEIRDPETVTDPILTDSQLASISAAVSEEITAAKETVKRAWLEIDGIEHLTDAPGSFVYRLLLSLPASFSPDQTVTFETRSPKETIQAVIVSLDDDGVIVDCQKPLPTDAKLLSLSFDPTFILRALERFVLEMVASAGYVSQLVVGKIIPAPDPVERRHYVGLNVDQASAVEEMNATPLYLLWGPPGTGKTTTLGTAVARWLRQKKRVLIVSTSNSAVDAAMRAVLKNLQLDEMQAVLRLGTSLDPAVREVTLGGKMAAQHVGRSQSIKLAQERLREIREMLQSRNLDHKRLHALHSEALTYEKQVKEFNEQAVAAAPELTKTVLVTGCTLAKMVLDPDLRTKSFDVVIVDEASMVSTIYALAASFLASQHIVYAGDPKQLPPIVQAEGKNAAKWFGENIYEWFGLATDDDVPANIRMLQTQYRMSNEIGGVVSRLSYRDMLKHGRRASGPKIEFVDVGNEWQTTHYSVTEKSYYHLAAIPILHALLPLIEEREILFLSPFRTQRSLLSALAFDLRETDSRRKISASTIHRAQGSEAKAVIVDLTTHAPQNLVAFFRDKHCEKLFNVAISRAKDRLFVLGSKPMLLELRKTRPFWNRVVNEFEQGIECLSCDEIIEGLEQVDDLSSVLLTGTKRLPAIYSHQSGRGSPIIGIDKLKALDGSRKLLVLPEQAGTLTAGDCIIRVMSNCPTVFVGGGKICLPFGEKWLIVSSPNVSRVVWRIGFSHLADDEVDPVQARKFFCSECSNGDLLLKQIRGEGWFLVCSNSQHHTCPYRRRLSLEDAKLKVRLSSMTCPKKHPLTVRQTGIKFFLGCENYPSCDHTQPLSVLEGI